MSWLENAFNAGTGWALSFPIRNNLGLSTFKEHEPTRVKAFLEAYLATGGGIRVESPLY